MPSGGSKPGGPQSKHLTPRYGNGKGYGGPAKGSVPVEKRAIEDIRPAVSLGRVKTPWGHRKDALAQRAMETWEEVMETSDSETNRMIAAEKIMDRVDGKPVQKIVTPESAPEWFIEGVVELSETEWTETAKLASSRPAGNAD